MKTLETKIPPPLIIIVTGALMWLPAAWLPNHPLLTGWFSERWSYPVITLLGVITLGLFIGALNAFKKARTTVNPHDPSKSSALLTEGVFSISRNPLYLAMLLILICWGLWLGNLASIVLSSGFVLYLTPLQIIPEERALQAKFGDEFSEYKRQVRRWI